MYLSVVQFLGPCAPSITSCPVSVSGVGRPAHSWILAPLQRAGKAPRSMWWLVQYSWWDSKGWTLVLPTWIPDLAGPTLLFPAGCPCLCKAKKLTLGIKVDYIDFKVEGGKKHTLDDSGNHGPLAAPVAILEVPSLHTATLSQIPVSESGSFQRSRDLPVVTVLVVWRGCLLDIDPTGALGFQPSSTAACARSIRTATCLSDNTSSAIFGMAVRCNNAQLKHSSVNTKITQTLKATKNNPLPPPSKQNQRKEWGVFKSLEQMCCHPKLSPKKNTKTTLRGTQFLWETRTRRSKSFIDATWMGYPPKAINEVGLFTGTEVGSLKMIYGKNTHLAH